MSLQAVCQRCGERKNSWTIAEAAFHVREVQHWKLQLCELCAVHVEMQLRAALEPPRKFGAVDPVGELAEPDSPTRDEEEYALVLPAIPGHAHIVNTDGTLGCGCKWPADKVNALVDSTRRLEAIAAPTNSTPSCPSVSEASAHEECK